MQGLLSNKYVLYGGAAIAALAAVWFFSSPTAPADDMDAGAFFPNLVPTSAGPISFGSGNGATAEGMNLGALIGLESEKAKIGERVSLAEIDAMLRTNLAVNDTNRFVAARQAETLELMAFGDIFNSASKLYLANTNAVAGAFNYNGRTFDFSTMRVAGEQTNMSAVNVLSAYRNTRTTTNAGSNPAVPSGSGQLSIVRAPTSASGGQSSPSVAPVAASLGRSVAAVTPMASIVPSGAAGTSRADRQRL